MARGVKESCTLPAHPRVYPRMELTIIHTASKYLLLLTVSEVLKNTVMRLS